MNPISGQDILRNPGRNDPRSDRYHLSDIADGKNDEFLGSSQLYFSAADIRSQRSEPCVDAFDQNVPNLQGRGSGVLVQGGHNGTTSSNKYTSADGH